MGDTWHSFELGILLKALPMAGRLREARLGTDLGPKHCPELSASSFLDQFLIPNRCCVIGPCLTKDWKAREWVDVGTGQPNWDTLKSHFGERIFRWTCTFPMIGESNRSLKLVTLLEVSMCKANRRNLYV